MSINDPTGTILEGVSDRVPGPNDVSMPIPSPTSNADGAIVRREKLRQLLVCPICRVEIYCRPIYQCKEGHIICGECHTHTTVAFPKCSLCQGELSNPVGIRNRVLEDILEASNTRFACPHTGCSTLIAFDDRKHLEVCGYKQHQCPLFASCHWVGRICELPLHLFNQHGAITKTNGQLLEFTELDCMRTTPPILIYGPYKGSDVSVTVIVLAIPYEVSNSDRLRLCLAQFSIAISTHEKHPDLIKNFRMHTRVDCGVFVHENKPRLTELLADSERAFRPMPPKKDFSVVTTLHQDVLTILKTLQPNAKCIERPALLVKRIKDNGFSLSSSNDASCQSSIRFDVDLGSGTRRAMTYRFQFVPDSLFLDNGSLRLRRRPFGLVAPEEIAESEKDSKRSIDASVEHDSKVSPSEQTTLKRKRTANIGYTLDTTSPMFIREPLAKRARIEPEQSNTNTTNNNNNGSVPTILNHILEFAYAEDEDEANSDVISVDQEQSSEVNEENEESE